jgi:sortase A
LWLVGFAAVGGAAWSWLDGVRYQAEQERLLAVSLAAAERGGLSPPSRGVSAVKGRAGATDKRRPSYAPVDASRDGLHAARSAIAHLDAPAAERQRRAAARSFPPAPALSLAQLSIPRLGMSVMVGEGVGARTLRRAAGHIPGTAPVGSGGNVGLAAHRDSFFRPLRRVEIGDEIVLTSAGGRETYRVEWTDVVSPQAVEVLQPTPYAALTLVTCYPFRFVGTAPDRFVVRARRVEEAARNEELLPAEPAGGR